MKRSMCISILSLLFLRGMTVAQNYSNGDLLHVVASSGLRLRTSPNANAGTIRVLECGESVVVQNTFDFDSAYHGRSGWLDGQWIYVGINDVAGYVFDAYLTSLAIPNHENELCYELTGFSIPLQQYLERHYPVQYEEQGNEQREDIDQCVVYHEGDITVTRTQGSGWSKTDVVFHGYRLPEVVNLFRSMLVGDDMREEFDRSLLFHQNKQGQTYRAHADLQGYNLRIEQRPDGMIQVSMTDLNKPIITDRT